MCKRVFHLPKWLSKYCSDRENNPSLNPAFEFNSRFNSLGLSQTEMEITTLPAVQVEHVICRICIVIYTMHPENDSIAFRKQTYTQTSDTQYCDTIYIYVTQIFTYMCIGMHVSNIICRCTFTCHAIC